MMDYGRKTFGFVFIGIPVFSIYKNDKHGFIHIFFIGIPLLRLKFTKEKTEISILLFVQICKLCAHLICGWQVKSEEEKQGIFHYDQLVWGREMISPYNFPSVQFRK